MQPWLSARDWTLSAAEGVRSMSDDALKQDVLDELDFEPSIDAAHIGVAVDHGVVTLTGHVSTYAQKAATEAATRRVKGVKGIAQEIEVRPFGANATADDEIARRALNTLAWNTTIPDNAVQITVQRGWVTLTGSVTWQYQKSAATDAIHRLAGVVGISNNIEIKPHLTSADVSKKIKSALIRSAEVEAQAIQVSVADGTVRLEGHVRTWSERMAAERAAWSIPGVTQVDDRISVS
jgi:osmotically-inducible protein OsmY